jgi:uncharacterized protein (DUF433 family)
VKRYSDRREMPRYTAPEAARMLKLAESTVWAWFFGQPNFAPLFVPADRKTRLLSFNNLIEAHVLSWTRQQYPELRSTRIGAGLEYVRGSMPEYVRPLINKRFSTEGKYLFLASLDKDDETQSPVNASKWGQMALPYVNEVLSLIEYDEHDFARLLYPRAGGNIVVINPTLSSGRPVVKGTGVLASIIWQRVKYAKEPIERLAEDYKLDISEVKAAIDYIEAAGTEPVFAHPRRN